MAFLTALALGVTVHVTAPQLERQNRLDPKTTEGWAAHGLAEQRFYWLQDGCPQPPGEYAELVPPNTNGTHLGVIVMDGHKYHGLFATRCGGWTKTFVITTTGEILALEDSGLVRMAQEAPPWR